MKSPEIVKARRIQPNGTSGLGQFRLITTGFLALLVVVGTFILRNQVGTNAAVESMFTESVEGMKVSTELINRIHEARLHSIYTLSSMDPNIQLQSADASRAGDARVASLLRTHASQVAATDAPATVRELGDRWLLYLKVRDAVLAAVLEGNREEALQLDKSAGATAFSQLQEALNESNAAYSRQADKRLGDIKAVTRQNLVIIGILLGLVALGAGIGLRTLGRHAQLLHQTRERFELAVMGSSDGIWDWDLDSNTVYYSPRWKEIIGYADHEIANTPAAMEERLHPADLPRMRAAMRDYLARRVPTYEIEFRMRHKDGDDRWILARGAALRDARGRAFRMAGSHTDITALKRANQNLVEASRQAGMAEIAISVLHNVGNVLNSVNVSAEMLISHVQQSKAPSLMKAVQLLREHEDDVGGFMTTDPKGKQLPMFLDVLAEQLIREKAAQARELLALQRNIDHIKQIVAMQQSYARVGGILEPMQMADLVEDALRLFADRLQQSGAEIIRLFQESPPVLVDKHKTLQILANLIANACHALNDAPKPDKRLTLGIAWDGADRIRVIVQDNGIGIPTENLARIFHHGFTTKTSGHGFGLHSGANAAREMGGSLNVESDGPGTGATFILELPVASATQPGASTAERGRDETRDAA